MRESDGLLLNFWTWISSQTHNSFSEDKVILKPQKSLCSIIHSSVQLLSHIWPFAMQWTAPRQASLAITNSQSLPKHCPLSRWCHPTISFSVVPFSSWLQSFPTSGSIQMSQLFESDYQIIGVSASTSVLPMNTQDWCPLGWMLGSPCSPRDSQESSPTPHFKSINSSAFFIVQLSHPYMTTEKP